MCFALKYPYKDGPFPPERTYTITRMGPVALRFKPIVTVLVGIGDNRMAQGIRIDLDEGYSEGDVGDEPQPLDTLWIFNSKMSNSSWLPEFEDHLEET